MGKDLYGEEQELIPEGVVTGVHKLADLASKNLLALGIVLFFIARLIALYGSAVKADLV